MSRSGHYFSWFTVLLLAVALMHVYFWWRLVHGSELPRTWHPLLTISLIVLAASVPAPFFANRYFTSPWREITQWVGYVWLGFAFLLFVTLLASELPRFILWFPVRHDPLRSLFFSRLISAAVVLIALGLGLFSLWNASRFPLLKRVRIALPLLPQKLSGTTIVQISDVHVGGLIRRGLLAAVVRQSNEVHPDIVAITGDLVDGSASQHAEMLAPIAELKARYGVFFVTGNHEYYSGVEPWLAELRRLGVRILRNERVSIGIDRNGFDLAGVDDPTGRMFHGEGADLPKALAERDSSRAVVLMAHNPSEILSVSALGVGLQISGHSHGGQIWPFNYFVRFFLPFISGWGRLGNTQIYVNEGTGFWGPPMRLGTRSEITLYELVPAPAS
ncbi:MAG: metallophosphoesterase [Pseudomonadota bacterium]